MYLIFSGLVKFNMELVYAALCVIFLVLASCQDMHVIEKKPGQCYKVHNPNQPRLHLNPRKPEYDDVFEACTQWLRENKNCLGLRTQNGEVVMVYCKGDHKRRRPGCYKVVNKDKREEIICQKINRQQGCEVITTRSNLTIVVNCNPTRGTSSAAGVFDVKDNRPKRQ
ncbi:uncharacterized protein LOC108910041 [Anoplophora glabripennis]|uniref:uncharacterized protein LOC108910041 n=1 Tax=Anoplophora glabripennis TaxID=217634 RepID=UPI000874837A|nr:uncharacterized protein LOC108910041 [Anoplophora glabripennis]